MPGAGVEPAIRYRRQILSLLCMPFHHPGGVKVKSERESRPSSTLQRVTSKPSIPADFSPVGTKAQCKSGPSPYLALFVSESRIRRT